MMHFDSSFWDFALKLSVLPVSGWALFKYARRVWPRQKAPPPGEVAGLLLRSLADHPEQWRLDGAGCLVWSQDPAQAAPIKLFYSTDPPCARLDGFLQTELNRDDQAHVIAAIQARADTSRQATQPPVTLGEIAREVVTSLTTAPDHWHQVDDTYLCYSPTPITHSFQAAARIWIKNGTYLMSFHGSDRQGDVKYNFTEREAEYVWQTYQWWHSAHGESLVDRDIRLTRKLLRQHLAMAKTDRLDGPLATKDAPGIGEN